VFLTTTLGLILRPLPLGATALLGLLAAVLLHTLTFAQARTPARWLGLGLGLGFGLGCL
jgi:di/tricarboxylate transporter